MKIALVAGGHLPIPPKGWGGVEHLIWNFHNQLKKIGDEVSIINTTNLDEIVEKLDSDNFDAVHLHYDQYANLMPHIKCNKRMVTSHYPYLENPEPQYTFLYDLLNRSESHIVCLSDRIEKEFLYRGSDSTNVSILPCGIDVDLYSIDEENVLYPDRSVVVGKIEPRKRQAFLQKKNLNIDFIGNNTDPNFDINDSCYYGEQSKQDIMDNLTSYANMVLLSSGEAHPFVCLEAMASGLGLVLSEQSTANLDLNQPFITVIPENKLYDTDFIRKEIEANRKTSLSMRKEIRQYCYDNFDWCVIIEKYKEIINKL